MKTAVLVRSLAEKVELKVSDRELHLGRLAPVLGINYLSISEESRRKLLEKGLVWIVGEKFVRKFRYAAGLDGGVYFEPFEHQLYPSSHPLRKVNYVGDIPEFALDNRLVALDCGLTHFTIHSCKPLPTALVFEKVDPVMIGWFTNPRIRLMDHEWLFGRFIHHMNKTVRGIVVAIWDKDKELGVL